MARCDGPDSTQDQDRFRCLQQKARRQGRKNWDLFHDAAIPKDYASRLNSTTVDGWRRNALPRVDEAKPRWLTPQFWHYEPNQRNIWPPDAGIAHQDDCGTGTTNSGGENHQINHSGATPPSLMPAFAFPGDTCVWWIELQMKIANYRFLARIAPTCYDHRTAERQLNFERDASIYEAHPRAALSWPPLFSVDNFGLGRPATAAQAVGTGWDRGTS